MREIKFQYILMRDDGDVMKETFTLRDIQRGYAERWLENNPTFLKTKLHIRQFTGLTDKNGVDIYEGDIVTGSYHNFDVNHNERGVVEFGHTNDSDGWSCGTTNGWVTTTDSSLQDLVDDNCEIIGNIHQHKELLA